MSIWHGTPSCQDMDSVDDILGNGEDGPAAPVDASTRSETEEEIPVLLFSSGTKCKGTGGSCCHEIIMVLVRLHVCIRGRYNPE
eukprot:scaffold58972_cov64-Attheya_sp.AAC.3